LIGTDIDPSRLPALGVGERERDIQIIAVIIIKYNKLRKIGTEIKIVS